MMMVGSPALVRLTLVNDRARISPRLPFAASCYLLAHGRVPHHRLRGPSKNEPENAPHNAPNNAPKSRQESCIAMNARRAGKLAWIALLLAATFATSAAAETTIRFTLDFKLEGPSAPFLVPLDKGYYSAEGLNVTIDTALGSLQPIERVASGEYDMGFGDINTLIKFRDAKPATPVKAVFMLYNRPPMRSSAARAAASENQRPGRKNTWRTLGRRCLRAMADIRAGQQHRCFQGRNRKREFPSARTDAGGGSGGCHHRLLVHVLC